MIAFLALLPVVIGGVDDAQDPAVVALLLDGYPYCSGTLIGARTVLTAGHCVVDVGLTVTVATGSDATDATFGVVEKARHPDYTGEGKDNDVALFHLDEDAPTFLALSTHEFVVGDDLRHVGFGVSDETTGDGRGKKRSVELPITKVTSTLVFSGADGRQTCDGDSGGPGLFDDGVASITSDGPNCHEDGWDIRVDSVRAFIDETLKRFEAKPTPASCGSCDGSFLALLAFLRRLTRS